ncbi:MAG TPA: AI-2E family transporter [Rhizomicrobium sp.]|nr:AI-2E family transporter [Rhizomicrobium sp.]
MADTKTPIRTETRTLAPDSLNQKFMTAVICAVVVSGIYFGRPVLMPLALAVLMSFALAPLVTMFRHIRLGHVPSVLLSLFFAMVLIAGLGTFVGSQLAGLARDLPSYQNNISRKIAALRGTADGGTLSRLNRTIEALGEQVSGGRARPATVPAGGATEDTPVPVVIQRESEAPWQLAQDVLGPLLEPLGVVALVLVFVGFILLQKDDLRDRFVRLAGSRDMQRTTVALDEAASRLSRYLFLQTAINASFGLVIGGGLWLIGIPNPGLWGLIAMLFRFVPYVGVPLAFLFPAILAVAVDPNWSKLIWVMVLYGAVEPIVGQAIEPFVYGRSMGLSAVAVVVALVFWTWLWGPVGLLLSTPLTMCFVVLGRHIQSLKFLDVMFGDEPPLAMDESLYLRMLADNPSDAIQDAEEFLGDHSISAYYDEVAARALVLAQADVNRGVLDPLRQSRIRDAIKGLIANLGDHGEEAAAKASAELPPAWRGTPVLCIAGRGPLDEAAALLLTDMLAKYGIKARVVPPEGASATQIDALDVTGVQVACLSYLEPGTYKNARYQVRRLRKRMPEVPIISIFWGIGSDAARYLDSVEATESDVVTTGLKETMHHLLAFARQTGKPPKVTRENPQGVLQV